MARQRSVTLDFVVYLAVRAGAAVLRLMPARLALAIMRTLAHLAYHLDRRHRLVAFDNLRQAFPGRYSEPELRRLVLDVYEHLAVTVFEVVWMPKMFRRDTWQRFVVWPKEFENITRRPLLLLTAHFGNWEAANYVLGLYGEKAHVVARPLDNPFLDRWIQRFRESTGNRVLANKGDFERSLQVLESGGMLCALADQHAGSNRGLTVSFFGRPASTHKALALLALRYEAAIVVVGMQRLGAPFRYELRMADVIDPRDYADDKQAVRSITQRATDAVEKLVRQDPKQYLWLHRRWKPPRAA